MKVLCLLLCCFVLFCQATCSPLVINYEVKSERSLEVNDNRFLVNNHKQSISLSFWQKHYIGNEVNNVFMARLQNHSSDTLFTQGQVHFFHILSSDGKIETEKLNAQIAIENNYVLPHAEMVFYAAYRNDGKTKAKDFYRSAEDAVLKVYVNYRIGQTFIKDSFRLKALVKN